MWLLHAWSTILLTFSKVQPNLTVRVRGSVRIWDRIRIRSPVSCANRRLSCKEGREWSKDKTKTTNLFTSTSGKATTRRFKNAVNIYRQTQRKRQERNPRQRQRQIKRGYETNFFGVLTNSFSAGRPWHFGSGLGGFSEGAFKVEGEGLGLG
jgi:hypothetical protein